jgi:hypothetical protein
MNKVRGGTGEIMKVIISRSPTLGVAEVVEAEPFALCLGTAACCRLPGR